MGTGRSTSLNNTSPGIRFLANDAYSIADIALFAYTHVAHERGFDLGRYDAILAWLDRVRATDGFVAIKKPR